MGSIDSLKKPEEMYESINALIYGIAKKVVGYSVFMAENVNKTEGLPPKRIYIDQDVGEQRKHTLRHKVYTMDADLLCEVHVPYTDSYDAGQQIIAMIRDEATRGFENLGITDLTIRTSKSNTETGRCFAMVFIYNYLTKVK